MHDITTTSRLTLLACALCAVTTAHAETSSAEMQEWNFRVYLGDSEIGEHRFTIVDNGDSQEVRSEAEFNVRFLFFNAYEYRHENTERWGGGCLEAIDAETDANGDRYSLTGQAIGDKFVLQKALDGDRDQVTLPRCVATFAYWDPAFLEEPRLLNTQTGEYVAVDAELIGEDVLTVRGDPVPAYRYRLSGDELEIDLWYSPDREWLALESATDSGRRLRYELI